MRPVGAGMSGEALDGCAEGQGWGYRRETEGQLGLELADYRVFGGAGGAGGGGDLAGRAGA